MTDRITAKVIGALFIVASATAIGGGTLVLPTVGSDRFVEVPGHHNQIVSGALIELILAMSVIGIAAIFYPMLKPKNEGFALCFVGARVLEGVFILGSTILSLTILAVSRDHGPGGNGELELLGDTLAEAKEWSFAVAMISFALSAMILNALLLRAKLVPSWLSVLGFAGGAMFLVRTVVEMYGHDLSPAMQGVSTGPIGLSEMILAGWLIAKGFRTDTSDSEPDWSIPEQPLISR